MSTLPREIPWSNAKVPEVPFDVRQRMRETIGSFVDKANASPALCAHKPMPMPTVSFELRGRTGGTAFTSKTGPKSWHLRFNAQMLIDNEAEYLNQIVPHEVAHLVDAHLSPSGRSSHGPSWQRVMAEFGRPADRLHTMKVDTTSTATIVFRFKCGCNSFDITKRKLFSAVRGERYCKKCKVTLEYAGEYKVRGRDWAPLELAVLLKRMGLAPGGEKLPAARPPVARPPALAPAPGSFRPRTTPPIPRPPVYTPPQGPYRPAPTGFPARPTPPTRPGGSSYHGQAGAASRPPPGPLPTEKQLAYAEAICLRKGLSLGMQELQCRRTLSAWIDANK